mmetsp:Transcript_34795/g.76193  ORF Transcript_34795/g.76193 Transcript_34795/m.76193 type:complete len:210 (-) Transcript_34795:755-1384(-)
MVHLRSLVNIKPALELAIVRGATNQSANALADFLLHFENADTLAHFASLVEGTKPVLLRALRVLIILRLDHRHLLIARPAPAARPPRFSPVIPVAPLPAVVVLASTTGPAAPSRRGAVLVERLLTAPAAGAPVLSALRGKINREINTGEYLVALQVIPCCGSVRRLGVFNEYVSCLIFAALGPLDLHWAVPAKQHLQITHRNIAAPGHK